MSGAYESFDTICIYLESDQPSSSSGGDPEKNFWVRYRMGILNQRDASRSVWRESSICTKTWNNSVLQFMKVQEMMTPDSGFLVRDSVIFVCEILDCCPWFEFCDLEVRWCIHGLMFLCAGSRPVIITGTKIILVTGSSWVSISNIAAFCGIISVVVC